MGTKRGAHLKSAPLVVSEMTLSSAQIAFACRDHQRSHAHRLRRDRKDRELQQPNAKSTPSRTFERVPDLSALNPQALSLNSWLLRLPALSALATRAAWWNPLWVEMFELNTMNRPSVCEQLLNDVLPSMPGVPGRFWIRGYVWRGGFTIHRITAWANGLRAMGSGQFIDAGPLTRIIFRVALGRYQAYALALLVLLFGGVGIIAIAVTLARGSLGFAIILPLFAMVLPLALALSVGRTLRPDSRRSEEADRLLDFLRDAIGAEVASH